VIKRLRTAMDLEDPGEDPWAELARYKAALERIRNAAQFGIEGMDTAEVLDFIVADSGAALDLDLPAKEAQNRVTVPSGRPQGPAHADVPATPRTEAP
jgi:hypothetical protein